MQFTQEKILQQQRRIQDWCVANPTLVSPAEGPSEAWSPLTRQLAVVNTNVAALTNAAASQQVHFVLGTLAATDEPSLRKHLRDELRVVTQMAQALRTEIPGIGTITMPPHVRAEKLLQLADALTRRMATYQSVFIEHGLASDFIAQLSTAMTALKASMDGRGAARAARRNATTEVKESVRLARQYTALMDAQLTKALKSQPAKLAEWKSAKHIVVKGVTPSANNTALTMLSSTPTAPALVQQSTTPPSIVEANAA